MVPSTSPTPSLKRKHTNTISSSHSPRNVKPKLPNSSDWDATASAVEWPLSEPPNTTAEPMNAEALDQDSGVEDEDFESQESDTESSVVSSSSEDPSDNESDEDSDQDMQDDEDIVNVPGRPKPSIHKPVQGQGNVLDRLKTFLPELEASNRTLLANPEAHRIEVESSSDEDEDERDAEESAPNGKTKDKNRKKGQYIEMNLGLGVLEEKHSDDEDVSSEGEQADGGDVLERLMGQKPVNGEKKVGIQEVGGG